MIIPPCIMTASIKGCCLKRDNMQHASQVNEGEKQKINKSIRSSNLGNNLSRAKKLFEMSKPTPINNSWNIILSCSANSPALLPPISTNTHKDPFSRQRCQFKISHWAFLCSISRRRSEMAALRSLTCFALAALLIELAAAASYTVGGTNGGWDTTTDVQTWASSQKFSVGDTLGE